MMRQTWTNHAPTALLLALALLLAAPAWAGGEKCEKGTAHAAHHEKATAIKKAGWTGMEVDKDEDGAYRVTAVEAGSPAAEARVRVGDRLVAYQGIALTKSNKEALHAAKKGRKVGTRVTYTVEPDGARRDVTMALVEVPDTVVARWLGQDAAQGEAVASVDG